MSQSRRWVFTLNNYAPADEARLAALGASEAIRYLVYGREIGSSGTPHLQGFVVYSTPKRLRAAKRALGGNPHVEAARGTSIQAAAYCKKDGDFEEFGAVPGPEQGRRNDFQELKDWVLEQPTKPTAAMVAREHPALFIKYGRIMEWIDHIYPCSVRAEGDLRPWQQDLANRLEEPPNDRNIIFVVDTAGGCGKSWFVKYWLGEQPELTQLLSVGKRDDLAFAIDESKKFYFFDLPRSQSQFLQYSVLEQLKDGMVFSPKYTSRTKVLPQTPHVVVFMNEQPDRNALSQDRYEVINLVSI